MIASVSSYQPTRWRTRPVPYSYPHSCVRELPRKRSLTASMGASYEPREVVQDRLIPQQLIPGAKLKLREVDGLLPIDLFSFRILARGGKRL